MINLIPQTAKRSVVREYWTRVVSVWLFILSFVLFIATTLLLPAFITVSTQIDAYTTSAEAALSEVDNYNLSSVTLVDANKQAQFILLNRDLPSYMELVKKIEFSQNDGIIINRFEFQSDGTKLKPISISGKATTRESLAQFRETLLSDTDIETVFLPISNLAQDKDISFVITITMKTPS